MPIHSCTSRCTFPPYSMPTHCVYTTGLYYSMPYRDSNLVLPYYMLGSIAPNSSLCLLLSAALLCYLQGRWIYISDPVCGSLSFHGLSAPHGRLHIQFLSQYSYHLSTGHGILRTRKDTVITTFSQHHQKARQLRVDSSVLTSRSFLYNPVAHLAH